MRLRRSRPFDVVLPMDTVPESGARRPVTMPSVVVLPAPLAPSRPVMAASGAVNERPFTAVTSPNRL